MTAKKRRQFNCNVMCKNIMIKEFSLAIIGLVVLNGSSLADGHNDKDVMIVLPGTPEQQLEQRKRKEAYKKAFINRCLSDNQSAKLCTCLYDKGAVLLGYDSYKFFSSMPIEQFEELSKDEESPAYIAKGFIEGCERE